MYVFFTLDRVFFFDYTQRQEVIIMAAVVKMVVTTHDAGEGTSTTVNRTYTNINRGFLTSIGVTNPYPNPPVDPPSVPAQILPVGYNSFWAWADAVARGLNSLSRNTFEDCTVAATWSTTEELAG